MNDPTEVNTKTEWKRRFLLENVKLETIGERLFISNNMGDIIVRDSDGWIYAECTLEGRVVNGMHDCTVKGRHCFSLIADALLNGEQLPSVIGYIPH